MRDSVQFAIIGIAKQRKKPPLKGGFLSLSERVNMKETPNYYAVLTADVRYDKNISANAKLLFAEITALSHKEGFAWASNKYFADLYGVNKDTVSRWVGELVKHSYIKIEVNREAGNIRKIYLLNVNPIPKNEYSIRKNADTYPQKRQDPIRKNADIIIQENIKKNNTDGLAEKKPAAVDHRGAESTAKEKIRQALRKGNLRSLKNA